VNSSSPAFPFLDERGDPVLRNSGKWNVTPVPSLLASILAPATAAPEQSATVPLMVPVLACTFTSATLTASTRSKTPGIRIGARLKTYGSRTIQLTPIVAPPALRFPLTAHPSTVGHASFFERGEASFQGRPAAAASHGLAPGLNDIFIAMADPGPTP
jgi:hypothetical protein